MTFESEGRMTNPLTFKRISPDLPDARELLLELNGVLFSILGHNGTAHVCYEDFCHDKAFFLVGYEGRLPVCCAGIRTLDETTGEVQRVYVRKTGKGIGAMMMAALEREASEAGFTRLLLECRAGNPHAIEFYKKNGYTLCAKYPPYHDEADAVCFEKQLPG